VNAVASRIGAESRARLSAVEAYRLEKLDMELL